MQIRTLKSHEVELHRSLRLRALRDAPNSFGETLAEAELRPLEYWQEQTRAVTESGSHVMFLACQDNYVIHNQFWRQGFGKEAVAAARGWGN